MDIVKVTVATEEVPAQALVRLVSVLVPQAAVGDRRQPVESLVCRLIMVPDLTESLVLVVLVAWLVDQVAAGAITAAEVPVEVGQGEDPVIAPGQISRLRTISIKAMVMRSSIIYSAHLHLPRLHLAWHPLPCPPPSPPRPLL